MPAVLTPGGRISRLKIRGERLTENVAAKVIGTPTLDLSVSEVSQILFTLADPGFELLRSGLFEKRTPIDYADIENPFEVAAVETGGGAGEPELTVTARSRGAQKMRHGSTRGGLVIPHVSPTEAMAIRCKAHGLELVGEPSAKRAQVVRADPKGSKGETDWEMGERLARELGYWLFEVLGTVYFARPRWLVKRTRELSVRYPFGRGDELTPTEVPTMRRSSDAGEAKGVTGSLLIGYDEGGRKAIPGAVLELAGVPTFGGAYIITKVGIDLDDDADVRIELATPIDPKPDPPKAKAEDLNEDGIADVSGSAIEVNDTKAKSEEGFSWPVPGPVTSGFRTASRPDHQGADIGCPDGTRCKAARSGTVSVVAVDPEGYGNWVEINHGGPWASRYGHFSKATVRTGEHVERGQVIGYTDSTGNAEGPHLHFEIRKSGAPVDPLDYLP